MTRSSKHRDAVERFNDAAPVTRRLQTDYDRDVIERFTKTGEVPSFGRHRLPSRDVAQRFAVEWQAAKRSGDTEQMETVIAKYEVQPQTPDLQTLLVGARDVLRELTAPRLEMWKPPLPRKRKRTQSKSDADARRRIVCDNRNLPSKRMCDLFSDAQVPLPRAWLRESRGLTWSKAYRDGILRRRIYKMISDDKSRC